MYDINDKTSAITEVQGYLHSARESDKSIPASPIDGIFGSETASAIEVFQSANGLPVTGAVDQSTFTLLYLADREYREAKRVSRGRFDNRRFPLILGSHGADVAHLHVILKELSRYYELSEIPRADFFSKETERAVMMMQRIFLLAVDGRVDEFLMDRLEEEIVFRKSFIV